ncbi:MAG TPA: hypothetical protein VFS02_23670 [Telluria sp.]|nr:hypothetical protein [Telluria sp.]
MPTKLVFESNLVHHVMQQEGTVEIEPLILLQLEFTDGPQVYTSGASAINDLPWSLRIRRQGQTGLQVHHPESTINYVAEEEALRCTIEVPLSPERYAAMLDMLKGGYVCEITVMVAGFVDKADYSKFWNTDAQASLPIKSICFEFPLAQNET